MDRYTKTFMFGDHFVIATTAPFGHGVYTVYPVLHWMGTNDMGFLFNVRTGGGGLEPVPARAPDFEHNGGLASNLTAAQVADFFTLVYGDGAGVAVVAICAALAQTLYTPAPVAD